MGNYVSCALTSPLIKNGKAARVVLPGGEVWQFREPTKAAELMLERPNFFLANAQSLHVGRRFSALSADEELEFGNVYVMFPMKKVGSVVTAADMALLFMAANSASKRLGGGNRKNASVSPDNNKESSDGDRDGKPRLALDDGVTQGFPLGHEMMNHRLSVCRSKKPLLETIKEEPVYPRSSFNCLV